MLGVADPPGTGPRPADHVRRGRVRCPGRRTTACPNHSPHFAPHIGSALRPAIAALTVAALDRFAVT
ncbi:hypothetical protein ACR6C2_02515 [Streptomyces sp. INA 01156]